MPRPPENPKPVIHMEQAVAARKIEQARHAISSAVRDLHQAATALFGVTGLGTEADRLERMGVSLYDDSRRLTRALAQGRCGLDEDGRRTMGREMTLEEHLHSSRMVPKR